MAQAQTVDDAARGVILEVLVEGGEPVVRAGTAPMLVLQPLEDAVAPRQVGLDVLAALGDRVTYAEVPGCGHAILPKQPDVVAANVIAFLRAHTLARRGDGS